MIGPRRCTFPCLQTAGCGLGGQPVPVAVVRHHQPRALQGDGDQRDRDQDELHHRLPLISGQSAIRIGGEIPYFRMLIICCVQYESSQYEMSLTIYEYNFIYWKIIGEAKVKFE